MPLSEHEQRLLEQIEQSLYAEDPKFARSWRTKDPGKVRRNTLARSAVLFVVGLAALLAGVITLNSTAVVGIALGAGGFLLMLGAVWHGLSTRQRLRAAPAAPKRCWVSPSPSCCSLLPRPGRISCRTGLPPACRASANISASCFRSSRPAAPNRSRCWPACRSR